MISLFEDLKSADCPGIYILINESTKKCYINFSINISNAVVRLLYSNLYFDKYDFKILELVTNPINLKPKCQFYKDLYSSLGYSIINNKRVSNLKLHICPIDEFRIKVDTLYLFSVKIVSKGYRTLTVGVFDTHSELSSFINTYYPVNLVTEVIYAQNQLTKEYLNVHKGE